MEQLLPEGIDSLYDLPHTFFDAIRTGLAFLSFQELPEKEQPPKEIWFDAKAMDEHWKRVKKSRKAMASGEDDDEMDTPAGQTNDAVKGLLI